MDTHYSGLSRINHWLGLIFVVIMMTLGYMMFFATDRAAGNYAETAHIGIGFFAFWFILWRTVYRLRQGFPKTHSSKLKNAVARSIHYLILLILIVLILTGPLYLFTENEALTVFNWFSINLDLTALAAIHEPVEEIHKLAGIYILPILLIVHIAAAMLDYLSDN
ncbi:cytochrome B561 [Pseudidiomarina salinarum]|uniref:Cytochrome B561 n=1 Tax=Pseudidiomarina salinarum TaxID=435908 RepID=A0A094JE85_9GAMM|nr:cytochrome b/b6 domain-containing protein [Pseudidiomarina salinarum]KFZ30841.1 cytochrome B561 [Pseudidiomarina salinarum]RUO71312.1 cytochrome B [Pseudidiomarina salinarum]